MNMDQLLSLLFPILVGGLVGCWRERGIK